MPMSALPPRLQSTDNWRGTDWDTWYQRWMLKIKWAFAYGPRATERWARWRAVPKVLFAFRGVGMWRMENDEIDAPTFGLTALAVEKSWYLSAIQYWCKWHVQLQWPFFVAFHFYLDDVPVAKEKAGNRRVIYFRFGARRDADKVFWFPSVFIGLCWN